MKARTLRVRAPFLLRVDPNGLLSTRSPAYGQRVSTQVDTALIDNLCDLGFLADDVPTASTQGAENPVFIMGCPRSGTTLLRYLIDTHERFACPPESKFIAGLYEFLQYPQVDEALASLGLGRADVNTLIRNFIEGVMGGYAARRGKPRWVDKTPNYYRLVDFIDEVFEERPRYLFIVRHPLDLIESWQQSLHVDQFRKSDPDITRAFERYGAGEYGAARYWCEVNEKLDVFARCHSDRARFIRYEDLAGAPEITLRPIVEFLGEAFSDAMIREAFSAQHDVGMQDAKILSTSRIEQDRIGRWRAWPAERIDALWSIVGPLAGRLGYAAPHANEGT